VPGEIDELLDRGLPPAYDADLYQRKCDAVDRHVLDADAGPGRGIDATAG